MGKVEVNDIRLFAYHGCLGEETIIGSDYIVDIAVWADLTRASASDELSDTVDYVHLHRISKEEMQIPSKLLEHAARRIIDRILAELPMVQKARVGISKLNPPIGGDVRDVKITLKEKRS